MKMGNACPARIKAKIYPEGADHEYERHDPGLDTVSFRAVVENGAETVKMTLCVNCGCFYAEDDE